MGVSEFVEIIKGISLIVASIVAILGIYSWRRESRWKKKFEVAEEVLVSFYEAREAIRRIRNPVSHPNEGLEEKDINPNVRPEFDVKRVVFYRFTKEKVFLLKLNSLKFKFQVVFEEANEKPFLDISKVVNKILHSSRVYQELYSSKEGSEYRKANLEEKNKLSCIIWEDYSTEGDEIKKIVNETVKEVEDLCRKFLK